MLGPGPKGIVQAFLLMDSYLQKRDRPSTRYNLIVIAYRMPLGLDIHRELPARISGNDMIKTERRKQVGWVFCCSEIGFSIITGKLCAASDAFIDVRPPRNIEDMVLLARTP